MNAPGESPFHVRGSAYLDIRAYADAKISGGMTAVAGALPEGPHRAFVMQPFDGQTWYDALPLRPLTEIMAKLEGRDWEASVRARAEDAARRDLGVLGRVRARASTPERMVERLQKVALDRFDFGESECLEAQPGQAKVVFRAVPQPLGSWFLAMMRGYAGVLIIQSGGKQPQIGGRLIPKGRRAEVGLVDVRIELGWSR